MEYEPKPLYVERISKLLDNNKEDIKSFFEMTKTKPLRSIRVNTLKISSHELKKRLEKRGWEIKEIFPNCFQIQNALLPGELGKTIEHALGYYYVQEITSMMPILALNPNSEDIFLDLCASPGSKTTQAANFMENKGTIIANDVSIDRIAILSSNLEKQSIANTVVVRHDGLELIEKLKKLGMKFDKILVDAPCSGEGNIRTSPKSFVEWSEGLIQRLSSKQKRMASEAINLLKPNGEMVYSTCTYSPEEDEEVIQYLLDNHEGEIKIEKINLPIKSRNGISEWKCKKFDKQIENCHRIYHHDNNMEGFFLCKIKKIE